MFIEMNAYNAYGINDDHNKLLSSYEAKEMKDSFPVIDTRPPVNNLYYPELWKKWEKIK